MQDVSICYKVHRSTGSISTVQSLQIIVDHRSKMQSQLLRALKYLPNGPQARRLSIASTIVLDSFS